MDMKRSTEAQPSENMQSLDCKHTEYSQVTCLQLVKDIFWQFFTMCDLSCSPRAVKGRLEILQLTNSFCLCEYIFHLHKSSTA